MKLVDKKKCDVDWSKLIEYVSDAGAEYGFRTEKALNLLYIASRCGFEMYFFEELLDAAFGKQRLIDLESMDFYKRKFGNRVFDFAEYFAARNNERTENIIALLDVASNLGFDMTHHEQLLRAAYTSSVDVCIEDFLELAGDQK